MQYDRIRQLGLLAAATIAMASCSQPQSTTSADDLRATAEHADALDPPSFGAEAPAEYPGVHNVVAYANDLYSGSAPEGDVGFESLKAMGIQTIISVDGARPDVELARAHGLRYVHLPIGYNGMDHDRTLEIARAVEELPGPIYIHCHHGKHRSAGAAGATAVTLGLLTPDEAIDRMHISGAAPNYTGLYQCVAVATIASVQELYSVPGDFPEVWKTSGLVQTMVRVEEASDQLKAIERAGWVTPREHPDLVPASEAGQLADLFRNLQDNDRVKAKPDEFRHWLARASRECETLEDGLVRGDNPPQLSAMFQQVLQSCTTCHAKYRD